MRMIGTVALVAVSMAAAGCGKAEYTYVSNTDDKAYFKVPSGWSEADVKPVDDYFAWSLFDIEPDSATRGEVDRDLLVGPRTTPPRSRRVITW